MPGRFDNSLTDQIQQANDIVEVVSEHLSLTKKGKEMVGLCPFHSDRRPSLYVNSVKQIFKCFACGAGGDVFKFIQMRENLTFPQAIERLAQRAGIKMRPAGASKNRQKGPSDDIDPNELARVNAWAAKRFQANLMDEQKGKTTRNYLHERKLSQQSWKKWQIGLADKSRNDLVRTAKAGGVPSKLLAAAGLVVQQADRFTNRLMFPVTDVTGRLVAFGGRTLDGNGAKYINSPATVLFNKSSCLYGLEHARKEIALTGVAVVVEGYTDCIMAHEKGCVNVVATLGTSFTADHGRILRRYAKKVVLVFDSDTAGIEAANRALQVCLLQSIDVKMAQVPDSKDPCDFLLEAGREGFEQLVRDATDVFQYKWDRMVANLSSKDTLIDRKAAIEEFLQTVAAGLWTGNMPAINRGLIVNRLSKVIGIDTKQINTELNRRVKTVANASDHNSENNQIQSIDMGQGLFAAAQREILEVLLNEPTLFEKVKQKISAEHFDIPILKQIAAILFEAMTDRPGISLSAILAQAETVEISSCVVRLAQAGEEKGNFQSRLTGAIETMQRLRQQEKNNRIETVKDQAGFLRRVSENAGEQNLHNVGMI